MIEEETNTHEAFESVFEAFSHFYANHPQLSSELVAAREDYFRITGKLNETDLNFTNRMNAFLLWFTFDWTSKATLRKPFQVYVDESGIKGESLNGFSLVDLENHIHSLFETKKLTSDFAIIRDLKSKEKFKILQPDFLFQSPKGTYFETRIFKIDGEYRFSNYFIQHPLEVKRSIKKQCKQIRKAANSIKPFLMTLHSYHTKWERYRNININSIYHFDKSIPEAK